MIVVLLGPDGSGKSTIADMIVDKLEAQGVHAKHHAHRFGILPPLSVFRLRRKPVSEVPPETEGEKATKPNYDLSENPPLRVLVYMSWYGIDYMLGGAWLRIKNLLGRGRYDAIFARYFYDYYYQSNNRRLPNSIKRTIELLVPKPTHIFFLDRDAQDIHDGKPELPVEEIENQQKIIRQHLSNYPQFQIINARGGAQDTADQILNIVATKGT